ncbi:MAG: NAD(P)/FAD-dependent oxidoreductase [Chthoniobacteraceae bacterium]
MIRRDYLIVGAGVGGASVCEGIREHDKKGTVMLVGAETFHPYHRPQLLKSQFAKSPQPIEKIQIHPADWYEKNKIDLRLDTLVTQINLERHLAVLGNGQAVEFRKACMATGSRPRRPAVAGVAIGNVFYPRSLRDMQALREVLELEPQLAIIGGGLFAAEVAAELVHFKKTQVTLLHRGRNLWGRFLDGETAAWLSAYFAKQGVKLMLNEQINGFEGRTALKNIQTKSGHRFAAGVAVVAIGAEPNLALVQNTPLAYPHGTPVNDYLETDEKGFFAVGDIASFPDKVFGGQRRVEYWECALAQGQTAGANMTGKKRIKWDWTPCHSSTVFDLHFDFVGDCTKPPTRIEIEGDRAKKKFIVRHYQLTALTGVVLCNQSPEKVKAATEQVKNWPRGKKVVEERE